MSGAACKYYLCIHNNATAIENQSTAEQNLRAFYLEPTTFERLSQFASPDYAAQRNERYIMLADVVERFEKCKGEPMKKDTIDRLTEIAKELAT